MRRRRRRVRIGGGSSGRGRRRREGGRGGGGGAPRHFPAFLRASAELGAVICLFPFNPHKRFGD